jgi:hypothetical protein
LIQFFFIYIYFISIRRYFQKTSKYKSSTQQKGQQKRFLYISYWTFEWTHCFSFQSSLIYISDVCA